MVVLLRAEMRALAYTCRAGAESAAAAAGVGGGGGAAAAVAPHAAVPVRYRRPAQAARRGPRRAAR